MDCYFRPKQLWVCLSAGERQALEWMNKARMWSEAFALEVLQYDELRHYAETEKTKAEIKFANGSRIIAIPANPDTARGYSANLVLDEFAIHEKPQEIWRAIYPSITNPINGDKKLRIVSTCKGKGNKFADIWHSNGIYSKHLITIHDAVADGLDVDLEILRQGVDDEDTWKQEFLCEFLDGNGSYFPYELLAQAEYVAPPPPDAITAPLYLGMDIGRNQDLSAIATIAKLPDGRLYLLDVEVLRKMPFAEQLKVLASRLNDKRIQKCCIDATGIGMMLAEEAKARFGNLVEGVQYTHNVKNELFTTLHRKLESTLKIPTDRDIREDLHQVQKRVSIGGTISFTASRNEDGHSDRANAIALAVRACDSYVSFIMPKPLRKNSSYDTLRI